MRETQENLGEATIPVHVFVRCPAAQWKMRQAKRCDGCEYFRGLTQRMIRDGGMPFEQEFAVRCGFPIDRELFAVEMEVAPCLP